MPTPATTKWLGKSSQQRVVEKHALSFSAVRQHPQLEVSEILPVGVN